MIGPGMLRVALTGGIATGKSYVRARIEARGVPTIDADAIVHELLGAGTDVTGEIAARFGSHVLGADGAVSRPVLAGLVFGDDNARSALERIVHPRVYARIFAWADEHARQGARWILADVPLLYETGREHEFDRIIVAACAPEEQVRRVMRRDLLSEEAARTRLSAQWPIEEKRRRATDVIETGGTFEQTNRQVEAVCAAIDGLARTTRLGG